MPPSATDSLSSTRWISAGRLASLTYTLDAGSPTAISSGGTVTVSAQGSHSLALTATDNAGNTTTTSSLTFTIDTTPPTDSWSLAGTLGTGTNYRSAVVATATASDSGGSGLSTLTYTLDAGSPTAIASGGTVTVSTQGSHTLVLTATDGAGNTTTSTQTFVVDTTAPTATIAIAGPSSSQTGTYRGTVTATFTASDATTGVQTAQYQLDGGTWTNLPGGNTINITADGSHTVSLQGTDGAGSTASATQTFKIDTTAPALNSSLNPNPNGAGWNDQAAVTVTLTGSDPVSGVQSVTYSATGAQPITSTTDTGSSASLIIGIEGTTTVSYYATDQAGNQATTQTLTVHIDRTAPTIVVGLSQTPNGAGWVNANQTITLTANDTGAGVASVTYSATGAQTIVQQTLTAATATLPAITTEGTTTVSYYANDNAGNQTTTRTLVVNLDKTAPTASLSLAGTQGTGSNYRSSVVATATANDTGTSGLSTLTYTLGAGSPTAISSGGTVTVSTQASHTLVLTSTDLAGNATNSTQSFVVDTDPPIVSVALSGPAGSTPGDYSGAVTATFTASDSLSGLASLNYSLDGGTTTVTASGGTLNVSTEGTHSIATTGTDSAGNGASTTSTFTIVPCATGSVCVLQRHGQAASLQSANGAEQAALPQGLVAHDTLFIQTPLSANQQSAVPSTLEDAGHHFTLAATDQTTQGAVTQFSSVSDQMTVSYTAADVPSGVSESNLDVYYFNTSTGLWVQVPSTSRTLIGSGTTGTITVSLNHLTEFGLLAPVAGGDLGCTGCGPGGPPGDTPEAPSAALLIAGVLALAGWMRVRRRHA